VAHSRRTVLAGLAAQPLLAALPAFGATAQAAPATHTVRMVEPVWIPVGDGLKLAARLWLPEDADQRPVPVVFEYIPYRTHDSYRPFDDHWGRQLAARGVAFARVDIRGSGNSEGVLADEYLASEQEDGVAIIAWLARQSWCNGKVGMRGISWGGFSTLQVAALAPPALKAIMPMCATDMRFANDAHYVGGSPGLTNLKWAAGFEMVMSGPPDPAIVGPQWEAQWRARLEQTPSIAARWLSHSTNDAYWRHGSVGLDYAAIRCPVYIVDGWADSYAESAERLLRGITAPKKALFGPWGHIYPDFGRPGPGLDWAFEELRWWRHWLADEDNGVMAGPQFRFYMPYATPSETHMQDLPGRWAGEAVWPSPNIRTRTLYLAPDGLRANPPARSQVTYVADTAVGLGKPEWIPYALAELPAEQSPDDARSLVFDLPALTQDLEMAGIATVRVTVTSDRPVAKLAARLCEVDAQGRSWLVTWGLLNLAYRDGLAVPPKALVPGEAYDVEIPLAVMAHRFKAGSRLRLALSESLWPLVWPSPQVVTLKLALGNAHLALPVRLPPAAEPAMPIPITHQGFSRGEPTLEIKPTDAAGWVRVRGGWPAYSATIPDIGTTLSGSGPDMDLAWRPADPASCVWSVRQMGRFQRGDWDCETSVSIEITADATSYTVKERLKALKNGAPFFENERTDRISRGLT